MIRRSKTDLRGGACVAVTAPPRGAKRPSLP